MPWDTTEAKNTKFQKNISRYYFGRTCKMKKTIRSLAILIAAVLCFTLLASCGTSGNENNSPAPSQDPGSSSAPSQNPQVVGDDKTEILVGYVAPFTGPLGFFTEQFEWSSKQCLDAINAEGGIFIEAYGKKLPIRLITADTQSDPNIAAEVATNLVLNNDLDLLIGAWTPTTSIPVSAVAERYKVPALMENSPAEAWLSGGPYEWASAMMFYNQTVLEAFADSLKNLEAIEPTNKRVGFVFDSDTDGLMWAESYAEIMPPAGYTVVDPGRFPVSTTDYTSIINQLKTGDCDVVIANMLTPNFITFWQQCYQLGYIPKVMLIGRGMEFMSAVVALGETEGDGIISETLWDKMLPYRSHLLNMSATELWNKYESETNTSASYCLGNDVTIFEIVNDTLSRCKDLEPETVREALRATNLDTVGGHMSFDENHVSPLPAFMIQWTVGERFPYEPIVISASNPDVPLADPYIIKNHTMG